MRMCSTLSTSTAYWTTVRQLRSVCTTTLATLRCTNISPGSRPTISFAGTRLSEQPIHMYLGACWAMRREKNSGSSRTMAAAQARLLANSSGICVMRRWRWYARRPSVGRREGDVGIDRLAVPPHAGAAARRGNDLEPDLEVLRSVGEGGPQVVQHCGVRGLVVAGRHDADVDGVREALHLHRAGHLLGDVIDVGVHGHSVGRSRSFRDDIARGQRSGQPTGARTFY